MTNILTAQEAADYVRCAITDSAMLNLLPSVDQYLKDATGHDWAADASIDPTAKLAAGTLLVAWYDNPSLVGNGDPAISVIATLEAKALKFRKYKFAGINGIGSTWLDGARKGDEVIKLIGTYGVDGDQSASFEAVISVDNSIKQISGADLSGNLYAVVLKHPADEVSA